jgi:hypothetical protein
VGFVGQTAVRRCRLLNLAMHVGQGGWLGVLPALKANAHCKDQVRR